MLPFDKFREECGVIAIYAHPEAEKLAYLGLHALQHRGQESAGIVTSDGMTLHPYKAMGLVADIFTEEVLSQLHGTLAIGHTRYSTAGDSALLNAQPILVQSNKGRVALAHNGNLVNAPEIRARLEARSEEHTSELQSQSNLVCRLLLEKKNMQKSLVVGRRHEVVQQHAVGDLAGQLHHLHAGRTDHDRHALAPALLVHVVEFDPVEVHE